MKKELRLKKISLSKETITRLTPNDLGRRVQGGTAASTLPTCPPEGWSEQSVCPTTTPSDCRPCN
ncbi:MAG TPA: class I lanthipeptide [Thermoanaerobaculia bacterium]|jgi:hypothetical protein|nr:class I lanthipeptide [Thermoanaerobaculia bacterium]